MPTNGNWYLVGAPPSTINLRVDGTCSNYVLGVSVGTTPNPLVLFDCPTTAGLYTFQYRVTNCSTTINYNLVVNYTSNFEASIVKIYAGTPCLVAPIIVDVDTAAQTLSVLWAANSYSPTINGRLSITDSCGNSSITSIVKTSNSKVHAIVSIPVTNYSGYIQTIRLKNSTTTFNINVSPLSSPYLSFSGSPWVVDPSDLYFSVAQSSWNTYKNALQNLILNAIHSLTGSQNNMCPFGLTTAISGGNFYVNLDFVSKHQPSALFTGLDHNDVNVVTNLNGTITSTTRYLIVAEPSIIATGTTSCGNLITVSNYIQPHSCSSSSPQGLLLVANGTNGMNVSYNNIVFGANRLDTGICVVAGNLNCNADSNSIKAIPYPPCPNATYLWNTTATTQSITPPSSGLYTVTITCDQCSDTASIIF